MVVKFIFDRIVALIGLLLLWPLLLLLVLWLKIRLHDGGSVLFRQQRIGKDGKPFTMCKFRTMTINHSGSSVSVAGDSRITPVGNRLRKYKLDELPELWNVLIGDMSFVGPRPDVPGYADKLTGDDRVILSLRPGLTGPASLKYRNEEELLATVAHPVQYNDEVIYPDKVRINRYYAEHYSFGTDLKMILCTISGKHMMYNNEMI